MEIWVFISVTNFETNEITTEFAFLVYNNWALRIHYSSKIGFDYVQLHIQCITETKHYQNLNCLEHLKSYPGQESRAPNHPPPHDW